MSLFDSIGGHASQQNNPMNMLRNLQSNPLGLLRQKGYNIPDSVGNNPQQIVQYLLQSGQMPISQFNGLQKQIRSMF